MHVLYHHGLFHKAYPSLGTMSQTAKYTPQVSWDKFVVHYSLPESIISDQGQNLRVTLLLSCARWSEYKNCMPVCTSLWDGPILCGDGQNPYLYDRNLNTLWGGMHYSKIVNVNVSITL